MTILVTERLTLRPMAPSDAEAYAAMRFHPSVARWLPPAGGDPVETARTAIDRFAAGWRQRNRGPGACSGKAG